MTLNLVETVTKYLQKHPEQKFTAREIANWILEAYPNKCQQKKENSTVINSKAELLQQIVAEIGARKPLFLALEEKKGIKIKMTEGRPRKYYFTTKSDVEEVSAVEHLDSGISPLAFAKVSVTELDLYPKLFEYLFLEFGLCSKRIDEKRSSNTRGIGGNRWLYPDVVAMENLSNEWVRDIKECIRYFDKWTRLWSFEVKLLINSSNIRECFFQAVSNSSWANFGYLVASEIEGNETLKELRMLNCLHGIGFIKLDQENPAESQVLIPAKEQMDVDWNIMNRIARENKDFLQYIESIKQFYLIDKIKREDWDTFKYCDFPWS